MSCSCSQHTCHVPKLCTLNLTCQYALLVVSLGSVVVNFGWNQLEFCQNNECVVSGYLLDYEPTLPTAFICFVESQGELLYEERFRGGNELSAEMDLPDVSSSTVEVLNSPPLYFSGRRFFAA